MNQSEKILELLQERGALGASNYELMKIAFQYPARIHALRHKQGYNIQAIHISGSQWHFTLIEKPTFISGKAVHVELDR